MGLRGKRGCVRTGKGNRRSPNCAAPDFLLSLVALAILMRLSLTKAAHVAMSSAARQEIRVRSVEKHFHERSAELQIPPLRCPRFPVDLGSVDELRTPFSTESRIRGSCECHEVGNPGTLRSG